MISNIDFEIVLYAAAVIVLVPMFFFRPTIFLYLLAILTFFPYWGSFKIELGSINIYLTDLLLASYCAMLILALVKSLILKEKLNQFANSESTIVWLVILYLLLHCMYFLFAVVNGVPFESAVRRFILFSGCLFFFFPIYFIQDTKQLKRLMWFIIILSLLFPVFQIYLYFADPWDRFITSSGTVRLAGGKASVLISCTLFALLLSKGRSLKYFLSVIPLSSLILMGHRSIMISIIICLVLLFVLQKQFVTGVYLFFGLFIGLFLILLGMDSLLNTHFLSDALVRSEDTFNTADKNILGRSSSIVDCYKVFIAKPFFGIGYNHEVLSDILKPESDAVEFDYQYSNIVRPHNFIMRFLSNTGLVGTILIISIIWLVYKRIWDLFKNSVGRTEFLILSVCTITNFLIVCLMNTNFFSLEASFFWLLSGLIVTLSKWSSPERDIHD